MALVDLSKSLYGAFNKEKPHSSITQWVDILTSDRYGGEAYEGIPELVESIKLQATGPTEASRAVRKKIKHGDTHQQYRAMVILKALVENCGPRFQSSFADSQLTDAIKHLATDSTTDPGVKKKTLQVLLSWQEQFKDDPGMQYVAKIYSTVKPARPKSIDPAVVAEQRRKQAAEEEFRRRSAELEARERRLTEQQQAKESALTKERERLARQEQLRKEEEARKAAKSDSKNKSKSKPAPKRKWDYEKEKPLIIQSIATASQASSNLVNAITLVNTENDSLTANSRVQECLTSAKDARKKVVRYIQFVENEELMGTLIETNERIITALEMYDTLSKPIITEKDVDKVQKDLAKVNIGGSELGRLQQKQQAAVQRAIVRQDSGQGSHERYRDVSPPTSRAAGKARAHSDLDDVDFRTSNLPDPIRPKARGASSDEDYDRRGSLSDYSDYESSDEDTRNRSSGAGGSRAPVRSGWDTGSRSASKARAYAGLPESDDEPSRKPAGKKLVDDEDPFADPFRD